jgi:hypothetical protein
MPIVVFAIIPLVFQRIARLVFALPPGASSPHEGKAVALTHAQVRHPTEVLDLGSAALPGRDEVAPDVDVRGIAWHLMDQSKALPHSGRAVVSFIIGHTPSLFRRLDLLEQKGMRTFFAPKEIVPSLMGQRLDGGRIRTQAVFGDDALEVRLILAQLGYKALGGIPLASMLGRSLIVGNRLRHERNDGPLGRMEDRGAQHRRRIGDGAVAVHPVSTRGPGNRLGRQIRRASERQKIMAIQERHCFQRLAALQGPKGAPEDGAEPLGGDGSQECAHLRVARDALDPVDGVPIARGPLLVKGEERRRFEGQHGARGHERIR